jgi:hypothetical protein
VSPFRDIEVDVTEPTGEQGETAVLTEFVDFLLPLLTPYEGTVYLYLLRHSHLKGAAEVRVGKRTIGADLGRSTRASGGNYAHVSEVLRSLEAKGCIAAGDTRRDGTLYVVQRPSDVPAAMERMAASAPAAAPRDYYTAPELRRELFERDHWSCQYCGDTLTAETATLDHFVPVSKGGGNDLENLRTCCLMCNSIKSGRTYEEVTGLLLASLRARRVRALSPS